MKIIIIAISVLALLIGLFVLYSFTTGNIETPQYKLLKTISDIEIRRYPKMVVAQTTLTDTAMDKNMNNGFRTIANYIFGGNDNNQKIAMTAPVVVKMGDTATMYFVMPSQYQKQDLPKPTSGKVQLAEESEKVLAVITYGGFSNDEKIALHRKKLQAVLSQNQIKTVGPYLYMGYNAPWDITNRRNEVAVEVVMK